MLAQACMSGAGYCGVADSDYKTMLNSEDENGNEFSITITDITGKRKAAEEEQGTFVVDIATKTPDVKEKPPVEITEPTVSGDTVSCAVIGKDGTTIKSFQGYCDSSSGLGGYDLAELEGVKKEVLGKAQAFLEGYLHVSPKT